MRLLPRSLGLRLLLALGGSAGAIVWLDAAIRGRDAAAAAVAAPVAEAPGGTDPRPEVLVRPVGGTVLLAWRAESIEPSVAPVVQVLADGSLALRRPGPLATGPAGPPSSADRRAAIVLPAPSLDGLDPVARGAFVDLVGRLVAVRPVPVDRLAAVDFPLAAADLAALLAWVP